MSSNLTEAETRRHRIDLQLRRAGWEGVGVDFDAELEIASAGEPSHGFTDYALRSEDGSVLAVVEAKRSSRDAIVGKKQAELYARAIEIGQPTCPFIFLANGDDIWYWDLGSNPRRVSGFFSRRDLESRRFQLANRQPLSATPIDGRIVERPYQYEAIRRAHEAFAVGKRRALWVMATGTGKTRTAIALIDSLLRARWCQRVLFLVDRRELGTQALDAFREYLSAEPATWINSGAYDSTKRLYVATLQTMQDFHSTFTPGEFDIVVSDECHRSIYNNWESVLSYFDGLLIGLTATPSDFIDRNTFAFFGCAPNVPTFAYDYDQAVSEGYLVPFRVYHARTQIQIEGIHGRLLPPSVQAQLLESGLDPEDINFEGTDLERRVTNTETTRLLVREFFENSITDPNGSLPGKSIIFAMSHKHATRLWEAFCDLYPQFPGLAEIVDSQMERVPELMREFKRDDMPRVAISVDMLDTGVDVPTVVNLAFMKPVYSKIKFWQMIGRGTRLIDDSNETPWCPKGSKASFRILDFWDNFVRFQINPDGAEPSASTPVAVRYFRTLVRAWQLADALGEDQFAKGLLAEARSLIDNLPTESAGVRENRALVAQATTDAFWRNIDDARRQVLLLELAPLLRYVGGLDLDALTFSSRCLEAAIAILSRDSGAAARHLKDVSDTVAHLPAGRAELAHVRPLLEAVQSPAWAVSATLADVISARETLSRLMRLRESEPHHIIYLNLDDVFQEQRWVVVGPDAREFDIAVYRQAVEARLRSLAESTPAFRKLSAGGELDDSDVNEIESLLAQPDLYVTPQTLRTAYDTPVGTLLGLVRHALGLEALPSRADAIRGAFEAFVTKQAYLEASKLRFVRLFAERLIRLGRVERADLYDKPFTNLGDTDHLLTPGDIDDLFALAAQFERAA